MRTSKKPLFRKWWFWVVVVFAVLLVIGALSSGEEPAPSTTPEPTAAQTVEPPQMPEHTSEPTHELSNAEETEKTSFVDYGEQVSVIDNGDGICILKYKIEPSYSNKATIQQNYHTVVNFIMGGFADGFDELQYWAVADMTSGDESKVIAFTVSSNTMDRVRAGSVVATNIDSELIDLWILPSLLED